MLFRSPCLVVVIFFLLLPGSSDAQQRPDSGEVRGIVRDATTGEPVEGASVTVVDLQYRTLTDSVGVFRIPDLGPGVHTFAVQRIGYRLWREGFQASAESPVVIQLEPRAVELEGLEVSVRARLDEAFRAREAPYQGYSSGGEALDNSDAYSVVEFFRDEHRIQLQPCPGFMMGTAGCVMSRGRRTSLAIFVDDMPFEAGASIMYSFEPEELYRVEYFPELGQLHIITVEYAEWMAETGRRPKPICIVCPIP